MLPILKIFLLRLRAVSYAAGLVLFFILPFVLPLLPSIEKEANRKTVNGGPPDDGWESLFREVWQDESKPVFYTLIGFFYLVMPIAWASRRHRIKKKKMEAVNVERRHAERNLTMGLVQRELRVFLEEDPNFSRIAFLEFACTLWQETILRLSDHALESLRPYYDATTLDRILKESLTTEGRSYRDVLIHSVVLERIFQPETAPGQAEVHKAVVDLHVSFQVRERERNLSRVFQSARLTFVRNRGVPSKPPMALFSINCQACGGALSQDTMTEACTFCGVPFRNPLFNWVCVRCELRVEGKPDHIGAVRSCPEELPGFSLPSPLSWSLQSDLRSLTNQDPMALEHLGRRLSTIFFRLHEGLDRNEVAGLRDILTERMCGRVAFIADGLRQAGLRRIHDALRLESAEVVRVERDRWFDTVTVRLNASASLYTRTTRFGLLVSGSRRHAARFSVYWTLVRNHIPPTMAELSCPRCGVAIGRQEVAYCGHCGNRLQMTLGDWELALIENPEDFIGDGSAWGSETLERNTPHRWLPLEPPPPPPPIQR
jgi:hypothetical protein